jgi:histidine triad (HIT) family protein
MARDRDCLFCRIASGEIPSRTVFEDNECYAFHDIHPQAPVHVLLIPRDHIASIAELRRDQADLVGRLLIRAASIANELGISESGYRVVTNRGEGAGQSVFHLHFHILGGRPMGWPPG